jgi:hypothetical protein
MTEADCRARLYGGPREIRLIGAVPAPEATPLRIRRLFDRSLGRRERKAA